MQCGPKTAKAGSKKPFQRGNAGSSRAQPVRKYVQFCRILRFSSTTASRHVAACSGTKRKSMPDGATLLLFAQSTARFLGSLHETRDPQTSHLVLFYPHNPFLNNRLRMEVPRKSPTERQNCFGTINLGTASAYFPVTAARPEYLGLKVWGDTFNLFQPGC